MTPDRPRISSETEELSNNPSIFRNRLVTILGIGSIMAAFGCSVNPHGGNAGAGNIAYADVCYPDREDCSIHHVNAGGDGGVKTIENGGAGNTSNGGIKSGGRNPDGGTGDVGGVENSGGIGDQGGAGHTGGEELSGGTGGTGAGGAVETGGVPPTGGSGESGGIDPVGGSGGMGGVETIGGNGGTGDVLNTGGTGNSAGAESGGTGGTDPNQFCQNYPTQQLFFDASDNVDYMLSACDPTDCYQLSSPSNNFSSDQLEVIDPFASNVVYVAQLVRENPSLAVASTYYEYQQVKDYCSLDISAACFPDEPNAVYQESDLRAIIASSDLQPVTKSAPGEATLYIPEDCTTGSYIVTFQKGF